MNPMNFWENARATLIGPVVGAPITHIDFRELEDADLTKAVQDVVESDHIEMFGIKVNPPFGHDVYRVKPSRRQMTLDDALHLYRGYCCGCDVPIHAIDVCPATFAFGRKGYALAGESAWPDGELIKDAMRMYFTLSVRMIH